MLVHDNVAAFEHPAAKGATGCAPVLREFYVFLPTAYHHASASANDSKIGVRRRELIHLPDLDPKINLFHNPPLSSVHCEAFTSALGSEASTALNPVFLAMLIDFYGSPGGCVLDLCCGHGMAIAGATLRRLRTGNNTTTNPAATVTFQCQLR